MRRGLAVSLLAVAVLSACGSGSSRRDAVRAYVADVNRLQDRLQRSVDRANTAYAHFSRGERLSQMQQDGVREAVAATYAARRSLEQLSPPPGAQRLHSILTRLLDNEAELSLEVELLVGYLPAAGNVLGQLRIANARANRELAVAHTGTTQAAALRRYAGVVHDLRLELVALGRPPTLGPWHGNQVLRLRRLERSAARLADALVQGRRVLVQQRFAEFSRVAGTPAAVTAVERRAVRSYDRRVQAVGRLIDAADRELARLESRLD